ncbi:hypothetical protein ACQPYE_05385 [Actinosynnema sp. CA-299493]
MVDHIAEAGHLRPDAVEHAPRTVPRHLFMPAATVEDAYANRSITIKPGEAGGRPATCISVPPSWRRCSTSSTLVPATAS